MFLFKVSFFMVSGVLATLTQGAASSTGLRTTPLAKRDVDQAEDITNSSWIWTNEASLVGSRPFRNITLSPISKAARFALCQTTADNDYTFYVNGNFIGTNPGNDTWSTGQMWYTDLAERVNVFAFNVTNTGAQAGLLAACRIFYLDGTIDTLLTDSNWDTVNAPPPTDFQSPYFFEDGTWVNATNEGQYGIPPWGTGITIPSFPPVIGLDKTVSWIWSATGTSFPAETRPFRCTFTVPKGKAAEYAIVLTTADNDFSLFVNGSLIGYGTSWVIGYRYVVPVSGSSIVFAVAANNEPSPSAGNDAGLIANIQIIYNDGSFDTIQTDSSWKTVDSSPPAGFESPSFNDSAWIAAVSIGPYGIAPWYTDVAIPPI